METPNQAQPDKPSAAAVSTPPPNGKAAMRTSIEVTGHYLLTAVDDSNERWSRPEWTSFIVTRVMCLLILAGGINVLMTPDLDPDARLMATILTPAAGFKLIEAAPGASNKRGSSKNSGGGKG